MCPQFVNSDNLTLVLFIRIVQHSSPPTAIAWGINIAAAGNDGKLTFYDENTGLVKNFEYPNDSKVA
jgi:hypothetical protein